MWRQVAKVKLLYLCLAIPKVQSRFLPVLWSDQSRNVRTGKWIYVRGDRYFSDSAAPRQKRRYERTQSQVRHSSGMRDVRVRQCCAWRSHRIEEDSGQVVNGLMTARRMKQCIPGRVSKAMERTP